MKSCQLIRSKLKNIPIEIIDGDRSSKYPKKSELTDNGVPFLNTTIIVSNKLNIEDTNFISHQKFSQIKKGRLKTNDIIFTTRGNGVGKAAIFNGKKYSTGLINAQMLILRVKSQNQKHRHQAETISNGCSQKTTATSSPLSRSSIRRKEVPTRRSPNVTTSS